MDDKENAYQYLVPSNVKTRFQFFPGFGWKELFILLLGIALGVVLFILLGVVIGNVIIRLIFSIIPPVFAFVVTRQDERTGQSLLNLIKDLKAYNLRQKRYQYHHGRGRD